MKSSTFRKTVLTTIPVITFFLFGVFQLAWAPAEERRLPPSTMLGPLLVTDGSSGAPSVGFASEPGTGWHLSKALRQAWTIEGTGTVMTLDTVTGLILDTALTVDGHVILGDTRFDDLSIWPDQILFLSTNDTNFNFVSDVLFDGATVIRFAPISDVQFACEVEIEGTTGIYFTIGASDADILTLGTAGTPKLQWVNATQRWAFDFKLTVPDATAATDAVNKQTGDGWYVELGGDTMTAPLIMPDGSKTVPSLRGTDADSGIYFGSGGKVPSVTIDDTDIFICSATGVEVVGNAKVSGNLTDGTKSLTVANAEAAYVHSGVTTGNPHSVTKAEVGLPTVEDTALSTWAGTTNVTTLGTIATGTWSATDVAVAAGGTGASTATAGFDALSPLTTKGDLAAFSTTNERVPVGTNGQVLTANNGAGVGVAWTSLPTVKSGTVAGGSFAGNPKVYTVTFNTAFPDTNYAVTIAGEDNRTYTFQTKLAGSFVINTNANLVFAGNVDWTATAHNDP